MCAHGLLTGKTQMLPTAQDAARRLLILLAINSHALRLMMLWDFTFRTAEAIGSLTRQTPTWRSLGLRGERLKLRAKWNWFRERRAMRQLLSELGLSSCLTVEEREFLYLGCQTLPERKRAVFPGRLRQPLAWPGHSGSCRAFGPWTSSLTGSWILRRTQRRSGASCRPQPCGR